AIIARRANGRGKLDMYDPRRWWNAFQTPARGRPSSRAGKRTSLTIRAIVATSRGGPHPFLVSPLRLGLKIRLTAKPPAAQPVSATADGSGTGVTRPTTLRL